MPNPNPERATIPRLLTPKQFTEQHPAFTMPWIRMQLFNRNTNGLNGAIIQIGRKIAIDEGAFFSWLAKQQPKATH